VGGWRGALEGVVVKVLVTGHNGYIGGALVPMLLAAGHEVTGMDSYLFADCTFGTDVPDVPSRRIDIRDAIVDDVAGFDAVVHLAGISNDPLGDLRPDCTYDINFRGAVHMASLAKQAGVPRFVFSSSCSLYGAAGDAPLDETADFNPVTPYGRSKVLAEEGMTALASDEFSPTFLRNATAFGVSARLRGDLVVNNLVGYAVTTGEVLLKSNGLAWRPLVHIEDISRAFLAVLHAPRHVVHLEAFNVGSTEENYRIREVAALVEEHVPDSRVEFADGASADARNYRVNCERLLQTLPDFRPEWTVSRGVEELYRAYRDEGLTLAEFTSSRYLRVRRVLELLESGALDDDLRWTAAASDDA